jgi:hypothetical protein
MRSDFLKSTVVSLEQMPATTLTSLVVGLVALLVSGKVAILLGIPVAFASTVLPISAMAMTILCIKVLRSYRLRPTFDTSQISQHLDFLREERSREAVGSDCYVAISRQISEILQHTSSDLIASYSKVTEKQRIEVVSSDSEIKG